MYPEGSKILMGAKNLIIGLTGQMPALTSNVFPLQVTLPSLPERLGLPDQECVERGDEYVFGGDG